MMSSERILQLFLESGAVVEGHFVFASWKHSDVYFAKGKLFDDPEKLEILAREMAFHFIAAPPDVLVSPQKNGVKIGRRATAILNEIIGGNVQFVPAEKGPNETFFIEKEFHPVIGGKRVGLVEDVLTTGGSVAKVAREVWALGGILTELVALVNRGNVTAETVGVPKLTSMAEVAANQWDEPCHLCQQNVPINEELGRGKEYMDRKRNATV